MKAAASSERKLRILLADESPARAVALRQMLYDGTWHVMPDVDVARDTSEVLTRHAQRPYQLIVLDARWRDGVALLEKLGRDDPETSVILIGESGDERAAIALMREGARDYLDRGSLNSGTLCTAIRYASQLQREEVLLRVAEEALRRSETNYRNLFEGAPDAIFIFDPKTELILDANSSACATYGLSRRDLAGLSIKNFSPVPEQTRQAVRDTLETGEPRQFETVHFSNEGGRIDMLVTASAVEYGGKVAILSVNRDISQAKRAELEIERLATEDPLTGLANRARLDDRLQTALAQSKRGGYPLAILHLDLDRFKVINDTLGHRLGDDLLRQAGSRLGELVRGGDTLARVGGDDFIILLYKINQADDAASVSRKIGEAFRSPFAVAGREVFLTVSIGIAISPHHGQDPETLLKNADIAMYRAKQQGRNTHQVYSTSMGDSGLDRLSLETDLHRAVETGQFRLVYQPKLDLRTGRIPGMEALVRWQHPERGLLNPSEFIPIAEETGLIFRLGEMVLRDACMQTKAWHESGFPDLRVAVNLSPAQFQQNDLTDVIMRVLAETDLPPSALEVEITETAAMRHLERAARLLDELTLLGVSVTMDDFGTGYSSLTYLRRFPISAVKIDKSFIHDLTTNANDASIARATIVMSHELRMRVIAEGVETPSQKDFLQTHGCDEIQGFLFSHPLAPGAFEKLLESER